MKAELKNYRGIESAELQIDPIALIAGINGSGKSSIAQGIAAALTQNPAPIAGITKTAAGQLLRDGTKRGSCTVGDANGHVTANWPGASVSHNGIIPVASPVACGLISIADMKPKDASVAMMAIIKADPTREQYDAVMTAIPSGMRDQIWQAIVDTGWDDAHKRAKERGTKIKGAWEALTGEKYGSQKAITWRHANHTDDRADDLEAAQSDLEAAIANQATDQSRIDFLKQQVAAGETATGLLPELQASIAGFQDAYTAARNAASALPRPEQAEQTVECPHCSGHLVVISKTDVRAPAAGLSDKENDARTLAIQNAATALQAAQDVINTANADLRLAQDAIRTGNNAAAELKALPAGTSTDADIAVARQRVADIQGKIEAAQATGKAATYHKQIADNETVLAVLAPEGLRKTVLAEKMGALNKSLATVSAAAKWPVVALDDDLNATLGGRAYILLSESEKYRVRVVLQLVLAGMDGSEIAVIDAADILDKGGRNGLFAAIKHSKLKALVCMTINAVADVPNLAAAGIGRSYWLADNVLSEVGK
jgi:hypothetical protein